MVACAAPRSTPIQYLDFREADTGLLSTTTSTSTNAIVSGMGAAIPLLSMMIVENLTPAVLGIVEAGNGATVINAAVVRLFLDKAAVDDGDTRAWSLCTVAQVEEAKTIVRMTAIFLSSILAYIPLSLLLSLTVEQAGTMDTRLCGITIPPASLTVIPVVVQILILLVYDRAAVPWLRRTTGYAGGVTHLQREGVGFASSVLAIATAAAVEGHRRRSAASTTAPPMSAFWLTPQFVLLCVLDVTFFVVLLEFLYSEVSAGMKSIGGSVVFCILGVASWLGSLLIQVVNVVTAARRGGGGSSGHGWLGGANLNASRLDLFYWLLAVLGLVSFCLYVLCAWSYTYRHDPRMQHHSGWF